MLDTKNVGISEPASIVLCECFPTPSQAAIAARDALRGLLTGKMVSLTQVTEMRLSAWRLCPTRTSLSY
eukprot:3455419-Pleurochrysis_carterae.AAC.1